MNIHTHAHQYSEAEFLHALICFTFFFPCVAFYSFFLHFLVFIAYLLLPVFSIPQCLPLVIISPRLLNHCVLFLYLFAFLFFPSVQQQLSFIRSFIFRPTKTLLHPNTAYIHTLSLIFKLLSTPASVHKTAKVPRVSLFFP